ncbi:hypothetical protein [Streptomyces sp. 7N604]|uniref:hypothetical protein n=1 Tax=Streptomyces sp. 7N604 TaxID=3457415 RepID=UPI003FD27F8E
MLGVADLRSFPAVTERVTMECAGNGPGVADAPAREPAVVGRGGRHRGVDGCAAAAAARRGS